MDVPFEIYKYIGPISKPNNGWTKELNLVSWNSREPVYDIRTWNEDHSKMGKGITITAAEMKILQKLIKDMKVF